MPGAFVLTHCMLTVPQFPPWLNVMPRPLNFDFSQNIHLLSHQIQMSLKIQLVQWACIRHLLGPMPHDVHCMNNTQHLAQRITAGELTSLDSTCFCFLPWTVLPP